VRRFVWVPFAVALLAFALPFATVSCDGSSVEASGADLVLRTAPETQGRPAQVDLGELVVSYGGGLATAAFLAFALGVLAAARPSSAGWAALGGLVGVAALVFLRSRDGETGAQDVVEVESELGGFLAAGAGAVAAASAAAVWIGRGRPVLAPALPVAAAGLVLLGYLLPSERTPVYSFAYADTLNVRRPWEGAFWLLPVVLALLLLRKRSALPRALAAFSVGALAVVGADVADETWRLWRDDDVRPGLAPLAFLAGIVAAGAWAVVAEWRQLRRPAPLPLVAGVGLALLCRVAAPV
jgi:hypothetical protein